MRKFISAMAIALLSFASMAHAIEYKPRVDGSWFDTACFGCPNDVVVKEVLAQQVDFDAADASWEADRSVGSLQACVRLALFSYDKAGYLLELARITGDASYWQQAADAANKAIALPANDKWLDRKGRNVPERSHTLGAKWLAAAQKHLK